MELTARHGNINVTPKPDHLRGSYAEQQGSHSVTNNRLELTTVVVHTAPAVVATPLLNYVHGRSVTLYSGVGLRGKGRFLYELDPESHIPSLGTAIGPSGTGVVSTQWPMAPVTPQKPARYSTEGRKITNGRKKRAEGQGTAVVMIQASHVQAMCQSCSSVQSTTNCSGCGKLRWGRRAQTAMRRAGLAGRSFVV